MAKKIEQLDKNFVQTYEEHGLVYYDIFDTDAVLYGAYGDKFDRMPQSVAKTVSENVAILNKNTSGERVRFKTDSDVVGFKVYINCEKTVDLVVPHMALSGTAGTEIYAEDKDYFYTDTLIPDKEKGFYQKEINLKKGALITMWLPLYAETVKVEIGIKKGCKIMAPPKYQNKKPIVFYGSSITQGAVATKAGNAYINIVCHRLNRNIYNLGFSGACLAEDNMADYIKNLDMELLVYDYDHNAPTAQYLKDTHRPFLQKILDVQPDLPVLIISKPRPWDEGMDPENLKTVYKNYLYFKKKGYNVAYINGKSFFKKGLWEHSTVENCHPTDVGFWYMANKIEPKIRQMLNLK